jgi:thiamine-monophosphate kinase
MGEFNLIQKYFTRPTHHTDLSIGDDAALIKVADGMQLVVSTDMLVSGTHFFADAAAFDIGWKSLAVNVSDMAAMGAQPKWATLAIALPNVDENWLAEFSRGFFACADALNIDLIGGDTTKGPLNISVTIMGEVPNGQALRRDGAKLGDDIWVSGTIGDAALALAILQNHHKIDATWQEDELEKWLLCLHRPQPRTKLGLSLRRLANSCIDISDGLLADLGHILNASNLGATIEIEKLPVSLYNLNHLDAPEILQCVLAGGDDYELCFTAPKSARESIGAIGKSLFLNLSCIGETRQKQALTQDISADLTVLKCQKPVQINHKGYNHFAT